MSKIWEKNISTDQRIERFTVGNDRQLDEQLAVYDIRASIVHANMLAKCGLIADKEAIAIEKVLKQLADEFAEGGRKISDDFEDIHSLLEYELTKQLGQAGKKVHTARSRNDQVLVALHLMIKEESGQLARSCRELFVALIDFARNHANLALPGYTHLQVAMPSSFGMWASAWAESLVDDLYLLEAAYKTADQNPLGSAAGYGSSFPIDRDFTTRELGFRQLRYNSVGAQLSRGKLEKTMAFACASLAATLSKLAYDIVLYASQNFGFLKLPDAFTTGSSIMPQKKNPDVFELIRGRCNKIQALPQEIMLLTNNLPSGYHRDFQLLKEGLFPAISQLKECLSIMVYAIPSLQPIPADTENPLYEGMYAVEAVNAKVQQGMSFREAYQLVAAEIADGSYQPIKDLKHTHQGSIGNLSLDKIELKFQEAFAQIGL